ncbi:c-type cytochrome [Limnohabitans lacus]|uniref:SorU family sulfite dehydrogenase c-type cytochrome subunit n=1 Tax=Limnohabitans lacus TaxID=3045173 RepID=UPI003D667D39
MRVWRGHGEDPTRAAGSPVHRVAGDPARQAADHLQPVIRQHGQGAVPACALCHALKDAGAEGAVGPSLDELKPDAKRVATALRNGIGQMPSYNGKLSDAQIAALAAYVAKASGGSK